MQATHTTQCQKNKQPSQKVGKRPKKQFSKEDIQMANKHEKMLNVAHYQRNANENYNEIPPHTSQNGDHQKVYKQCMPESMGRKGNRLALLVGM